MSIYHTWHVVMVQPAVYICCTTNKAALDTRKCCSAYFHQNHQICCCSRITSPSPRNYIYMQLIYNSKYIWKGMQCHLIKIFINIMRKCFNEYNTRLQNVHAVSSYNIAAQSEYQHCRHFHLNISTIRIKGKVTRVQMIYMSWLSLDWGWMVVRGLVRC